jgi:hypothetical protein
MDYKDSARKNGRLTENFTSTVAPASANWGRLVGV